MFSGCVVVRKNWIRRIACPSYGNAHRSCGGPPAGTKILAGLLPKSVVHGHALCNGRDRKKQRKFNNLGVEYLATNQELAGRHVIVGRWSGGRAALILAGCEKDSTAPKGSTPAPNKNGADPN